MTSLNAKLVEKEKLNEKVFSFWLECNEITKNFKPGQFVNIFVEGFTLRRPISICEIEKNLMRIVFVVKGKGTKKMANLKINENLNLIGPLGKGFSLDENLKDSTLLIGGGIGVAPLLELQKKLKNSIAILGFNRKKEVILEKDFRKYGDVLVYTVAGDYGEKGFVTKNIEEIVKDQNIRKIAACGPEKMLKSILLFAKKNKIYCEISFEERMGCGIGACLCCKKRLKIDENEKSFHVCKDGPVISFDF